MWALIGSLFSSVIGGGITGILGVVVQRVADYKNKQLDLQLNKDKQDNEVNLRRIDASIMAQEWAARTKVAQVEEQGKEAQADAQAFQASFQAEPQQYSSKVQPSNGQAWVFVILDVIRGLVRPSLTVYLCVLTTLVYFEARTLITSQTLTPDQALEVVRQVTGTILYLTTTCILWYFGTRNKQPQPQVK